MGLGREEQTMRKHRHFEYVITPDEWGDGFAEIEGQRIRLMTVPHPFKPGPLFAFMYGDKLLQLRDETSTFKTASDAHEAAQRHGFIIDKDSYITFGPNWRP
jgi:hypothetical protein